MAIPKSTFPDVFWQFTAKRTEDECWHWTKSFDQDGYGVFHFSCKNRPADCPVRAHQVSLYLHKGPKPTKKHQALHKCNIRSCVNPKHLYWGTHRDNMDDLVVSGIMTQTSLTEKRREFYHSMTDEEFDTWVKTHSEGRSGRALSNITTAKRLRNER